MKLGLRLLAFSALAASWAATASAADEALVKEAAAANGGQIVLQSAFYDDYNAALAAAFNKEYGPKGLKLIVSAARGAELAAKYDQELRVNKVSQDIVLLTDEGQIYRWATDKKLTPYCSPNFKDFKDGASKMDCSYFTALTYLQYIGYNTDQVKEADAPKAWKDFLDPKWKGKLSIPDPKIGGGNYIFVFTIYKLYGKEWFEKVRANDPLLNNGHGTANNQLLSGERAVAVDLSWLARPTGQYPGGLGGPVKEVFPSEGGALIGGYLGVTKGGPNTAGAKVFLDWASSLEGQKVFAQLGYFSLRKDFSGAGADDLNKIKYHIWDPVEMDQKRTEWTNESIAILTRK